METIDSINDRSQILVINYLMQLMEEEINQLRRKMRKCEENIGVRFLLIVENF